MIGLTNRQTKISSIYILFVWLNKVKLFMPSFASGSKAPWKHMVIPLGCKDIRIQIFEFKTGFQFFFRDNDLKQTRVFPSTIPTSSSGAKISFLYLDIIDLGIRSFYQNFSDSLLSWIQLFFF